MTNPFKDQKEFMLACGQTTDVFNEDQLVLYSDLIDEEILELCESNSEIEVIDALVDIIVVCIGALHSTGVSPEAAWNAIHATNMAKIDPVTGKVKKREDGKILKHEGWVSPETAIAELLGQSK